MTKTKNVDYFLTIRNFDAFQHYKTRNPPWIKLYFALLSDRAFYRLPDSTKFHVVGLFLIASQCGNKIPLDIEWISKQLASTEEINLQQLLASGFIELVEQPASKLLARRKQSACLEKSQMSRREELDVKEKTDILSTGVDALASAKLSARFLFETYNRERGGMPEAQVFTQERRRKCDIRLRTHQQNAANFLESFTSSIQKARDIPFMLGAGSSGWIASFDWFIANDTNYLKVLEGKYDARPQQQRESYEQAKVRRTDEAARKALELMHGDSGESFGRRDNGGTRDPLPETTQRFVRKPD